MQTSSNVISFAAFANARRAGAEIASREAATQARIESKIDALAEAVDGLFGLPLNREVARAQFETETAAKYVPAYCDPENEVRGSKYEATKGMRVVDVAKRVRDDIKALALPKGVKVSVRSDYNSIDIRVTALPADFPVMSTKAASWRKQFGENKDYPFAWAEARSAELSSLIGALQAIHGSYNRDNSDSMSDYFDTRFYGNAEIDWKVRAEAEAREIAASAGDYWADCD